MGGRESNDLQEEMESVAPSSTRARAEEFKTGGMRREDEAPAPPSIRVAIKTEEAFEHKEDNVGDTRASAKQAAVLPERVPSSAFIRSAEIKKEDRRSAPPSIVLAIKTEEADEEHEA